jgi:hypothetical protein
MKHIDVYRIDDFRLESPEIHSLTHEVKMHVMKPEVEVQSEEHGNSGQTSKSAELSCEEICEAGDKSRQS